MAAGTRIYIRAVGDVLKLLSQPGVRCANTHTTRSTHKGVIFHSGAQRTKLHVHFTGPLRCKAQRSSQLVIVDVVGRKKFWKTVSAPPAPYKCCFYTFNFQMKWSWRHLEYIDYDPILLVCLKSNAVPRSCSRWRFNGSFIISLTWSADRSAVAAHTWAHFPFSSDKAIKCSLPPSRLE